MLFGPSQHGELLEIGVLAAADNDSVIDAMAAGPRCVNMIRQGRGESE
jgi:hypothetical protein